MPARLLFAAELLSTLSMFGIIWFVQVVHYPMFANISPSAFVPYETAYANRMGFLVGPLMLAELLAALLLLIPSLRPHAITTPQVWWGLALLAVIWASTAFIQVPLHNRLHAGYDPQIIRTLVNTNWLRTVAWTARAALVLWWTVRLT